MNLRPFAELCRPGIAIATTFTTITGYVLVRHAADILLAGLSAGVFLIASGSSALNQYQERQEDGTMARTRGRPLPTGRLIAGVALPFSVLLIAAGWGMLLWSSGACSAMLGLLACIMYNGIYTPLKRQCRWAVIPGAVAGGIPPVLGWVGAGGGLWDAQLAALCGFLFCWQIAHSLVLQLSFAEQYRAAGIRLLVEGSGRTSELLLFQLSIFAMALCAAFALSCAIRPAEGGIITIAAPSGLMLFQGLLARQQISDSTVRKGRILYIVLSLVIAALTICGLRETS